VFPISRLPVALPSLGVNKSDVFRARRPVKQRKNRVIDVVCRCHSVSCGNKSIMVNSFGLKQSFSIDFVAPIVGRTHSDSSSSIAIYDPSMTESQTENFSQNVQHGCYSSVRGLCNASKRGKYHFLECTLNSKLNTEIGGSASPSCVLAALPTHEELPAPVAHL
jgi:hypothetical protein